jgi:hypothetical protein
MEKSSMFKFFGATYHFTCGFCEEKLLSGYSNGEIVVLTEKEIAEYERQKQFEAFCPSI